MKQTKGKSVDIDVLVNMFGERPSREEIKRRIQEKEWTPIRGGVKQVCKDQKRTNRSHKRLL